MPQTRHLPLPAEIQGVHVSLAGGNSCEDTRQELGGRNWRPANPAPQNLEGTMTQPLPLRTKRQFILSNNKWLVRTVPLRRRELILRELCHRCFVQGQKAVLDDFFGTGDSDAAGVDNNDLEHCESSVITENDEEAAAAAAAVEADIIDAPIEQPSQDHTNDGSSNNTALISELYPNAPCLHIGSNAKTWFDFGADEYNVVGSRHCLPILISAPGSSESFEEDEVDLALYFDVEISCGSNNELGVSLEADCADAISLISSNLQFTIKEGECQVVYIVWSPSCQGGLRQSIFVKTTFNRTSDLVADDEIVAVGSARKSAIDMMTEVHEGVHHANMHHVDLAHSTLDDMSSTEQINEIKGSDEHAPSFIGEEDSPHDVEQNFSIEEERHGAYTKSDQPEQHSSDQTQNGQPHEKAASVNVKPMENGSKEKSGVVTLSFNLKSGLNITSSTTHSNQQLHSSIQNRMSRIRAQRATTSNARDSRGRPIRQTHPSVAVNFAGLSNRAKLMRYNRMLAANKQKEAADESKQTNDSSNEKVEAAEKKDALADGEDAQFEVEDDVTKQAHEKVEHRCGVLLLSPLSETAGFKNIGEEAEHRGAVLLQTPPNTQEASRAQQESGENEANSTIITNSSDADDRDECVEHRFDSPNTKTMLQTMVNVSVEVDESKLTANLSATEDLEVQHAASAESLADEISDMKDYLSPRDQHPVSNESAMDVSMFDVSIDEPENAVKPEIFTFGDNSSPPKSNQKGDENVNDEVWIETLLTYIYELLNHFASMIYFQQMTSPDTLRLSKSYENTTNELDDLIDKVSVTSFLVATHLTQLTSVIVFQNQQKSTKQSITPLQDLHDKINHIINTQKAVSPVNKKNVDITPEVKSYQ